MGADREITPGRHARNAARRYMESLETERSALQKQIADLARALEQAAAHHREAHRDCVNSKVEGS